MPEQSQNRARACENCATLADPNPVTIGLWKRCREIPGQFSLQKGIERYAVNTKKEKEKEDIIDEIEATFWT